MKTFDHPDAEGFVQIESQAGEDGFDAYWREADAPNGRSIVLLHEIFGVTRKIRGYADDLAGAGFNVLVPDLFWRLERRVELNHDPESVKRAISRLGRLSTAGALDDVRSCVAALRARGQRVALLGFCLGGKLVVLSRNQGLADAYVGYYGVGLDEVPGPLDSHDVPLLMHYGGDDPYVPLSVVEALKPRLGSQAQVCVYPNAGHAFYMPGRDEASDLSRRRTLDFLDRRLPANGG